MCRHSIGGVLLWCYVDCELACIRSGKDSSGGARVRVRVQVQVQVQVRACVLFVSWVLIRATYEACPHTF